jgi:hypothetical protein
LAASPASGLHRDGDGLGHDDETASSLLEAAPRFSFEAAVKRHFPPTSGKCSRKVGGGGSDDDGGDVGGSAAASALMAMLALSLKPKMEQQQQQQQQQSAAGAASSSSGGGGALSRLKGLGKKVVAGQRAATAFDASGVDHTARGLGTMVRAVAW